jgi:hypothetical protein
MKYIVFQTEPSIMDARTYGLSEDIGQLAAKVAPPVMRAFSSDGVALTS